MIAIKMDPRMKKALQKSAEEELVSMSTLIRQLVDRHLKGKGIDWREEEVEK
ncbi:MAG: ribbon-helix-helix protein, CopG family [Syntrophobacteria bacterium]